MKALMAACLALAGLLAFPLAAWPGAGVLDATFGNKGRVSTDFGGYDGVWALAVQPDQKILAAGAGAAATLARYQPDGTLDPSFGTGGKRLYDAGYTVWAVTLQSDGRILSAASQPSGGPSMVVFRTDASGNLDTTFAGTGQLSTNARGGNLNRVSGIYQQPDGRIVFVASSANQHYLARYLPDGTPDASYNGTGIAVASPNDSDIAGRSAMLADGRIVIAGQHGGNFGVVRYGLDGSREMIATHSLPVAPALQLPHSIALQSDGRILVGVTYSGSGGPSSWLTRLMPDGSIDASFGSGGFVQVAGLAPFARIIALPNGKILVLAAGANVLLSFNADGSVDTGFGDAGRFPITPTDPIAFNTMARQADGRIVAGGTVASSLDAGLARVDLDAQPFAAPNFVNFGGQSMGTTSLARTVTLTNGSALPVTVSSVSAPAQFSASSACGTLQPGASCPIEVRFTPAPAPVALNASYVVSAELVVASDLPGSPHSVTLYGVAEKSLITHFYQSILRRPPDGGGFNYWAARVIDVRNLGADPNETWFAMAPVFFGSAEYQAMGQSDADFVRDLYRTFFNRDADGAGLTFWFQQLAGGLPRDAAIASFDFSTEFRDFSSRIFGNTAARAEVDLLMDFYRGILGRLPDADGFASWRARFRSAQCQGAAAVTAEANAISSAFLQSPEYAARARDDARFVADLYNAFMRRGADRAGLRYWVDNLIGGATREEARAAFVASPEFQARVGAVIAQGCL